MVKATLIQTVYTCPKSSAEEKAKKCYHFAELYNTDGRTTIFMENKVIEEQVMNTKAGKIAVCSWALSQKMKYYIGQPRPITQELLESDYEVLSFTKNTKSHHMLSAACVWHPNFLILFDKILKAIGVLRPGEVKMPIYQNHFSARTDIYRDYVKSYLTPAMDAMSNDPDLHAEIIKDAGYSNLMHADYSFLKNKIGIPYMPYAPFLLERLFSVFVHNRKISVTHL